MANWIEKNMSKKVRDRFRTSIITALGFFLALQYNETIVAVLESLFPVADNGIAARIIYVILITIVIVYISVYVEKGLDGK